MVSFSQLPIQSFMPDKSSPVPSGGLYVTVIVAVLDLPAVSVAVTLMTLIPLCRATPDIDQSAHPFVVVALPFPPLKFAHVTLSILTSLLVVPAMSMGLEFVVKIGLVVGRTMEITGALVDAQDTEILVTLADPTVPVPLAIRQLWPSGCVSTVTLYALPPVNAAANVNDPLEDRLRLPLPLFCRTTAPDDNPLNVPPIV